MPPDPPSQHGGKDDTSLRTRDMIRKARCNFFYDSAFCNLSCKDIHTLEVTFDNQYIKVDSVGLRVRN